MKQLQEITEESDEDLVDVEVKPEVKWDCQSILSTYSNLYNHPKIIEEPKVRINGLLCKELVKIQHDAK